MNNRIYLFCFLNIAFLSIIQAQQKDKISNYLEQIKKIQHNTTKRTMGLETINQKSSTTSISSNWIHKGDKILINAFSKDNVEQLKAELETLNVTDLKIHGSYVTGWISIDKVYKLDNCISLNRAMPEIKPVAKVGLTTSQAVRTMFTQEASRIFDVNGDGIRIGILSNSYNSRGDAATTVANGDLPGIGNPNGFTKPVVVLSEQNLTEEQIAAGVITSDEGRGMAELVHDIAPGAELFLRSATNGYFDFADGIRELAAAGCDIIVDDIGYLISPFFQDGAIAQAANEVTEQGVVYLTAAGNSGTLSYEAPYNSLVIGPDDLHNFNDRNFAQTISINNNSGINLSFQWANPSQFAGPSNPLPETNLDIFLFNNLTRELLAFSVLDNAQVGAPIEILGYQNQTGATVLADIVILKRSGPSPELIKYIDLAGGLNFVENIPGINAGTAFGQSNAEGAISVGAQAYIFNPEFGRPLGLNNFSSFGGIPTLMDVNGNRIEPIVRQKPDLIGTDAGNTTSFPNPALPFFDLENDGFPNFIGTSAAAPNVAAVVALMLQENKDLSPQEVKEILFASAADMDNPLTEGFDEGFDFATGYGFTQADKALAIIQGEPTVYRYQAINATSDEFISTLSEGSSLFLEQIDKGLLNIVALSVDGFEESESLLFDLSGAENRREQDNTIPYSLFGDDGNGNFRNWEAKTGEYQLTSTAFDQMNLQGESGNNYTVNFAIRYEASISSFILVNADTNEDIGPLTETINLSLLEENPNINIRAEVGSVFAATAFAEKVQFNLSGAQQRYNEDVTAPYSLFGDNNGDYNSWQPAPVAGTYTLEATPFARRNGTGTDGNTTTFTFEIIDDTFPSFANNFSEASVFFNQNSKSLLVSNKGSQNVNYSVFNAQGEKIHSNIILGKTISTLNMSSYGTGLFIVKSDDAVTINSKIYIVN